MSSIKFVPVTMLGSSRMRRNVSARLRVTRSGLTVSEALNSLANGVFGWRSSAKVELCNSFYGEDVGECPGAIEEGARSQTPPNSLSEPLSGA